MTFAIIQTGGKQYKVKEGDTIRVEKLETKGEKLVFDNVLLKVDGESIEMGAPYLKGAAVEANVKKQGRDDKKIVFRYHAKTRYRKFKTHRQLFTEVTITKIS